MSSDAKNFLLGVYDDEDVLLDAVKSIRSEGVKIHEVYSPFPVHGLDQALGYTPSRLTIVAFCFGFLGCSLALTMQTGMMTFDWPMIIGGKDHWPLPAFIPVTFELTVLLAAFGMVGTFLVMRGLKPWAKASLLDIRITDDKHILALDLDKNSMGQEELVSKLQALGASEVNTKILED